METEGRPGARRSLSDEELDQVLEADAAEFDAAADRLDHEGFVRRTLEVLGAAVPLPDATADDFGRVGTAAQLRTPEAWAEWLGLPTGRKVWLEDPARLHCWQVPETNYMARAAAGNAANGYVKTGEALEGLDIWRKR